ncbi:MAG: ABC transporter ATP-binding protein, partial [Vulcanimicrobiaceae bacterium]
HYPRILQYVEPDVVHIMMDGRIVKTGNAQLAHQIEAEGYDRIREEATSGAA